MYAQYWLRTFDYKGISKLSHLIANLFINIIILIIINLVGLVVPVSMENFIVTTYYVLLIAMLFPTAAMIVRVLNRKKR
ncbi:hypothetical protein [Staphylococcus sp. 17KM0847]|uniref:hypothetical protein n=1 Tax=Staphylococcus sp. 17KM0847 TaxID=2583989 RepID=UPI0015DC0EEA|nr:hypothetical protein [Staphylococcus sp. 17KM0847]QLK86251.1 hypothetical protein FGL66_05725 [Staphylococcus sp. 17KM0847]